MDVDLQSLFARAAQVAADHRTGVGARPVQPDEADEQLRASFGGPLQTGRTPPDQVLDELVHAARPGLMGTVGPRFFGFVTGGALPAASAADLVSVGWDQCAYNEVLSPAAAAAERGAGGWLKTLLGRIVASEERHATIDRAARLLGFGLTSIESVRADVNGAISIEGLREVLAASSGPTIVCLQAGNVNTGACDDLAAAIPMAREVGAWVHVDGAFGLWAAASPRTAHLVAGLELADSWGTDAHKWLNVPYDSGLVFCADPVMHRDTMHYSAAYLTGSGSGGAAADYVLGDLTPESSRRARGFAVWAALRELGSDGVADLVDRCCVLARRMAAALVAGGATIHNDIVLNQVLVSFPAGEDGRDRTDAIIERVQLDGTCWVGGTTWRGQRLMRVSVSNAATTERDIDTSAVAILQAVAQEA